VTFAGLAVALRAILGVVLGIFMFSGGIDAAKAGGDASFFEALTGILGFLAAAIGFVVLAVNLFAVAVGLLVLQGRRWAWIAAIVFVSLAIAIDAFSLVPNLLRSGAGLWLVAFTLLAIFDVSIVVALGKPVSRRFFGLL
jgi:hypothetical protein